MLYHMGARNFECKECGNKFYQMEHLKRHMQSIHNIQLETGNVNNNENQSQTRRNKRSKSKLTNNKNTNNDQESPSMFNNKNNCMNQELKTEEIEPKEQNSDPSSKSLYKCLHCEYVNANLFNLNQHILREHALKNIELLNSFDDIQIVENIDNEYEEEDEDDEYENQSVANFSSSSAAASSIQDENLFQLNVNQNQPFFVCSFCKQYKTNIKYFFKVSQISHSYIFRTTF
jgi:hypothetical protein